MESAALTLLAASMGVLFGWQPMPDGSDRYEYLVQIEPAMLDTLRAGESIPITSDIPEEIGPIGRIRIVVGDGPLPRQQLVTNLKPWPEQESREGLVEAQFTVPPVESNLGERYGVQQAAADNQILPSQGGGASSNPFGQALQRGAQQAREAAGEVTNQILPPSGNELFGNAGDSVRQAVDNSADRLARGLQQGAQQAANEFGNRAANAIDQFGRSSIPPGQERSLLTQNSQQANGSILPPDSQSTPQSTKGQRIDEPIQPRQPNNDWQRGNNVPPSNFAEDSRGGSNPTSQYGEFNAPWPQSSTPMTNTNNSGFPTADNSRYPGQNSQPGGQPSQWPREQPQRDSFDLANLPSDNSSRQPSLADNRPPGDINSMEGPSFPNVGGASRQSPSGSWPNSSPTPEIRKDMLDEPAGNDSNFAANNSNFSPQQVNRPTTDNPTGGNFNNWPQGNDSTVQTNPAGDSNNQTLFPLLLSWVLLSGSGAGNLYLFWSYFDLRSKYHGLVHGGRHSRYDD